MKRILLLICFQCYTWILFAQTEQTIHVDLNWDTKISTYTDVMGIPVDYWQFQNATFINTEHPLTAYSVQQVTLPSAGRVVAKISNVQYQPMTTTPTMDIAWLGNQATISTDIVQERQNFIAQFNVLPIRRIGANYERLTAFDIVYKFQAIPNVTLRGPNIFDSVLREGDIYKIAITESGIYKLDAVFLEKLGINIANIDPRTIKIYGNGGGLLPEANAIPRIDDLTENAIEVVGEEDGTFNSGDFILFYGEEPNKWRFDNAKQRFRREQNIYSNKTYYFIKIGGTNGLRITEQERINNTTLSVSDFDDYFRLEDDKYNLLSLNSSTQGSGKRWFGDAFSDLSPSKSYKFDHFKNLKTDVPVTLNVGFAGRSGASNKLLIAPPGSSVAFPINPVSLNNSEGTYANIVDSAFTFNATQSILDISITYPQSGNAEGWLDFIELNARRNLIMEGNQMRFCNLAAINNATRYSFQGTTPNIRVWDISNPLIPKQQALNSGDNSLSFGIAAASSLHHFIAFKPNDGFLAAEGVGKIENQNLHNIDNIDFLIIYHSEFEEAALRLAQHRREYDTLNVAAVRLDQVYNEFASGAPDLTAIRDMARMLFDRNTRFKYLLLFGDGSFDYKNILNLGTPNQFIPAYETDNSLHGINSFPSDDYYALLSENEGVNLAGALDIAVGRMTVKSVQEANDMVNKITHYDGKSIVMGDWQNRITSVADDEDGNTHLNDAEEIALSVAAANRPVNVDKVFIDAYVQLNSAGGQRYPAAEDAINNSVFKGQLVVSYMGHGGPNGWAQERILRPDHINSWRNFDKMPLFITATCTFAGYDKPDLVSAGEATLLNEQGGAIALFSTVRPVLANSNAVLTQATFNAMYQRENGKVRRMGEMLRIGKNNSGSVQNSRKFTMLGDPSQQLAIPTYNIVTTKVNDIVVEAGTSIVDTFNAFQKVTIEGMVTDLNGAILNNFNGKIYPTVFDKPITVTTLAQDPSSDTKQFPLQRNIIFKGAATVSAGKFTFSFVVPKDINYAFGNGKISYYATDEVRTDAAGYFDRFLIGGTDLSITDDQGPKVEIFMNDESFQRGDITGKNPTLLVKLSDDYGINVVGNSIGHDLSGLLDENANKQSYVLNNFYEAALDDYTSGSVRYPLFNLAEGQHTIKVKAWDIANNSGESSTEFIVSTNAKNALEHILNYPNPFTTNTNFQFAHTFNAGLLDVEINIYTIAGRLVKTIFTQVDSDGGVVTGLNWDGKDEYGDQLARGVYVYQIRVGSNNGNSRQIAESKFERLVILK